MRIKFTQRGMKRIPYFYLLRSFFTGGFNYTPSMKLTSTVGHKGMSPLLLQSETEHADEILYTHLDSFFKREFSILLTHLQSRVRGFLFFSEAIFQKHSKINHFTFYKPILFR